MCDHHTEGPEGSLRFEDLVLPSEFCHQGFGHNQVGGVDQVQDVPHLVENIRLHQSESSEERDHDFKDC